MRTHARSWCPSVVLKFLPSLFALLVVAVQSLTGDREVDDREYELKNLLEGERFTPLFKVRLAARR